MGNHQGIKQLKKVVSSWISDESGQSTTEYVLLLLMVVMAINQLKGVFGTRLKGLVESVFTQAESQATGP